MLLILVISLDPIKVFKRCGANAKEFCNYLTLTVLVVVAGRSANVKLASTRKMQYLEGKNHKIALDPCVVH